LLTDHPHLAALREHALHRMMGVQFRTAQGGKAHLSFVVAPEMIVPAGALHAGYVYTARDLASYAALMSELDHDVGAVTHDLHVSVMRTAGAGEMVDVHAEIVRRGRTLAFLDARAVCGDRLLATARVTKSLIQA
jgi:uncharacterized protein (TIGR00369 family)